MKEAVVVREAVGMVEGRKEGGAKGTEEGVKTGVELRMAGGERQVAERVTTPLEMG